MRKKIALSTVTTGIISASLIFFAAPSVADDKPLGVSATFGVGLNTAQPGNAVNHKILPKEIKVKSGGVVNFTVAGFHDIIVFNPGTKLADPFDPATGQLPVFGPNNTFVFDPVGALPANIAARVYYRGINPAGGRYLPRSPEIQPMARIEMNRSDSSRREPTS